MAVAPELCLASSQSLWPSRRVLVRGRRGRVGDTLEEAEPLAWTMEEGAGNAGASSPRQLQEGRALPHLVRWHQAQRRHCLTAGRGTVRALAPPEGSGGVGQENPELGRVRTSVSHRPRRTNWRPPEPLPGSRSGTRKGPVRVAPATHGREQSCQRRELSWAAPSSFLICPRGPPGLLSVRGLPWGWSRRAAQAYRKCSAWVPCSVTSDSLSLGGRPSGISEPWGSSVRGAGAGV